MYHICMRRPGEGGGGVTQATIDIYHKYIKNSERAQYILVSQNLISSDLLAIKLNKIAIYHIFI